MQTVSPSPTNPPAKGVPAAPARPTRSRPRSYAPVGLAVLLVIVFFGALSFVIATDDVASVVNTLAGAGWVLVGAGVVLALGVLARRGREVLGLGLISAGTLLATGVMVVAFAPSFSGPAHYSQGQQAFAAQNYERAIQEFRQAGNREYLRREIPEAHFKWGEQLAKNGDFQAALNQFDQVSRDDLIPNQWQSQVPDARARVYLAWAARLDRDNSRNFAALSAGQRLALDKELLEKYDAVVALEPGPVYLNPARSGARNVLYRQAEELKVQNKFAELEKLYQRISVRYLDGKPQTQSELELRQANNFWEWGRQYAAEREHEQALRVLGEAEDRFSRYDPRRLENLIPDIVNNFGKLAPQLIAAGKYDEAITRLDNALKTYGSKDPRNVIGQALVSSYVEYGKDYETRNVNAEARNNFKLALDLSERLKLNVPEPREGLGRTYLALGQEGETGREFERAIALYREGLKARYFSALQTATANAAVSRAYFSWARATAEQPTDLEKAINIYRDGLQSNGFEAAARNQAIDAAGDLFLKLGTAAEQRTDPVAAINMYNTLANDPLFKTSAASRNLVNIAPKVMFPLAEKYLNEARQLDPQAPDRDKQVRDKLVEARTLLQNLLSTYGTSEQAPRAREILNAQVVMSGKILNNKGEPLTGRKVRISTEIKFCTAALPADDPDCRGAREGFVPKGEGPGFETGFDGGWEIKLDPNKTYLLSWQERGGKWTSVFNGQQARPEVTIKTEPMLPIRFEYRTPTEAPL